MAMTGKLSSYRCIEFNPNMNEKTVSKLHIGSLRLNIIDNRCLNLF